MAKFHDENKKALWIKRNVESHKKKREQRKKKLMKDTLKAAAEARAERRAVEQPHLVENLARARLISNKKYTCATGSNLPQDDGNGESAE